jgi:hypothetical protein
LLFLGEMQPTYNVQGHYAPPPISGYQLPNQSTGWQPGVGYATSNAPHLYSNIPPPSQLSPITGKRKALLIGINCIFIQNILFVFYERYSFNFIIRFEFR